MDKPMSMSVKDYLMRVQSVRTNTPLKTIEAVVDFQFQEANAALHLPNVDSIELSGFGKFSFNKKKALKKWEKNVSKKEYWENALLDPNITEAKRNSYKVKLENTVKWMEFIKPKLNEQAVRICSPDTQGTT